MGRLFRRKRGRDDEAVVEVIGFIFAFAISAVILVISTQAFMRSQESTDHIVNGVELRGVANRIASRILQAGIVAEEFPNATFTTHVRIPDATVGRPYVVEARDLQVFANLTLESLSSNATTYKLDALPFLSVDGRVYSSAQNVEVQYSSIHKMNTDPVPAVPDGAFPYDKEHVFRYITIDQVG